MRCSARDVTDVMREATGTGTEGQPGSARAQALCKGRGARSSAAKRASTAGGSEARRSTKKPRSWAASAVSTVLDGLVHVLAVPGSARGISARGSARLTAPRRVWWLSDENIEAASNE